MSHSNVDPDGRSAFGHVVPNSVGLAVDHEVPAHGNVGLSLSTVQTYVVIISLLPGGSALASGNLKVGDLISSINGVEPNGDLELAYELLKGPAYSQVQLSVIRFDPYGSALSSEIFLQRLPIAPLSRSYSSLVPYSSLGSLGSDTPRKAGTPLATSRTPQASRRDRFMDTSHPATNFGTPGLSSSSSLVGSNVSVESIPTAATSMNPANTIGFVIRADHPYYRVLEDIRRTIILSTISRSSVLQSVTEMDFRDMFSSETDEEQHGMSFREFSPRVFAVLRHFWSVDSQSLLDAFKDSAIPFMSHSEEKRGLDACGSVYYCPSGRFILKFISEAEFHWLLDFLPSYYNHFYGMHEQGIVSFMWNHTRHIFFE